MSSPILRAALWALPVAMSPFVIAPAIAAPQSDGSTGGEPLTPVVVTASRFDGTGAQTPGNVTTITQDDIRATPGLSLPDVLATRAGVNVSAMYGPLGIDATVDMGGFGSTATSNTLIMVDGQRVNPTDMGAVIWSAIPLESVERIEIMRNAGTVLYGDRATAGVINIITKKAGQTQASATVTLGSYNLRGGNASLSASNEHAYFNLFGRYTDTDGYRNNSWQNQQSLGGRAGFFLDRGEVFTDFTLYKEASGLPGGLTYAQFQADPRQAKTPTDSQWKNGYRVRPGISYDLTDTLRVEGEVGIEHQDLLSNYYSANYISDRNRDTVSFTPRLRWKHGLGPLVSETVVGMDYYDSTLSARNQGGANQNASQTSTAFYLQNSTELFPHLTLTLGGRTQHMHQSASEDAYPAWFQPAMSGSGSRTRGAYDVGLAYARDSWRIYGKTGTTFRFANLDELFGYDNVNYRPVFAGDIRPQHGTIYEWGGSLKLGDWSGKLSFSRLDLNDEIGFNTSTYANTNFDPTRRDSANLEIEWQTTSQWSNRLSYNYLDATFRSGPNTGKTLPLAPRDQLNWQSTLKAGIWGTYSVSTRYVGQRRLDGDFANTQNKLGDYVTADLQASWTVQKLTLTAKVLNILDKRYAAYAGPGYYYPADGRAAYVSARYDF